MRRWMVGMAALALTACGTAPEVHYRMTVEVDTPEGVKTGSSVWAWRLAKGGLDSPYSGQFQGEAITVDLGERGTLFGLLLGRGANGKPVTGAMQMLPERVFGDIGRGTRGEPKRHRDRISDVGDISRRVGALAELNCSQPGATTAWCPLLVTFGDPRDPSSVEAINPNGLANEFGHGVRLRRVTIEITDDSVTTGIDKKLSWWDSYKDRQLNGRRYADSPGLNAYLNRTHFSRMD